MAICKLQAEVRAMHRESASASASASGSANSMREAHAGFMVGERVHHQGRGAGIVDELMQDGRTRIRFDSGEEHRCAAAVYHLASIEPTPAVLFN